MHAVFVAVFVVEGLSVGSLGSSHDDDDDEASSGFPRRVGAECVRDDCGDVEDDDGDDDDAVREAVTAFTFTRFATDFALPWTSQKPSFSPLELV